MPYSKIRAFFFMVGVGFFGVTVAFALGSSASRREAT
jgi:hypothetical protein